MNFKKWVKSIQTAGYNGARTVYSTGTREIHSLSNLGKFEDQFFSNLRVLYKLQT